MRVAPLLIAASLVLSGCNVSDKKQAESSRDSALMAQETPTQTTTATASPTASPEPPTAEPVFLPDPNKRLPRRPGRIAAHLERLDRALDDSLRKWRWQGDIHARPPKAVVWQTLYQQRLYRLMARRERLGDRTLRHLDGGLLRFSRANVIAGRALRSLVTAVPPKTRFRLQAPESAGQLMRYYRKAQRRFGIDWEILAAINYVETKFGRVRSASSAGAQGPMQFIPATWDAYGMGGDVHDPHDAIMGAANYLRASGAPGDYRGALFAYNHADAYVTAILRYARQMMRLSRNYFAYYNWQVFVITTAGEKRLTGPGL